MAERDELATCSMRPMPEECGLRIAHDMRQRFLSGLTIGIPVGASIVLALVLLLGGLR